MPLTLLIDALDLSSMVRLQPGEGFDPGQNPVEPVFGENSPGEGQPLLGFGQANKLMSWPVWLTPRKTGEADTKDGLHTLVSRVNLVCKSAQRVEWRDDQASLSTFWDVVAAKFEPEHSYFHSATPNFLLKGTLKVWVSTYGDTGTLRLSGTAAGTGVAVMATAVPSFGDIGAQVRAVVSEGSNPIRDGRLVGVAAVGASYTWNIPLSQATLYGGSLVGASGAAGSQMIRRTWTSLYEIRREQPAVSVGGHEVDGHIDIGQVVLSPASQYVGRNRMFAVTQTSLEGLELRLVTHDGNVVGGGIATGRFPLGWGTVDLGVLDVPSHQQLATLGLRLQGRYTAQDPVAYASLGAAPSAPHVVPLLTSTSEPPLLNLTRILAFPARNLAMVADTDRVAIAGDGFARGRAGDLAGRYDFYGNQWRRSLNHASSFALVPGLAACQPTGGLASGGLQVSANTLGVQVADAKVEVNYDLGGALPLATHNATTMLQVGKEHGLGDLHVARVQIRWPTSADLSLVWASGIHGAASVHASLGISLPSSGGVGNWTELARGRLSFRSRGDRLFGELAAGGTVLRVEALVASGARSPARFGWPLVAARKQKFGTLAVPAVYGVRVSSVPSGLSEPGDRYVIDGTIDTAYLLDAASLYRRSLDDRLQGNFPQVMPGENARVVGFSLPLDNDPANDLISLDVRIRERFVYAR